MDRRTYLVLAGGIATLGSTAVGAGQDGDPNENGNADEEDVLMIGTLDDLDELPFDADVVAELEGDGSTVTDEFELDEGLALFVYESENVDDEGIEADLEQLDGDFDETWTINEVVFMDTDIDEVTGATLSQPDEGEYILDLGTDGEWDVHVVQLEAPQDEVVSPPVSASGEHSAVFGPIEADGGLTISGEHDEGDYDRMFDVLAYPEDPEERFDFAFTEDPGFEGETRVDVDGVTWIEVNTLGEWAIEVDN
ncbi:hypothetical protein [Natronorubrum sp. A-ect3]|uniref:hypothetical protein n=1 Tax=Natronorubrum sp. A-ect3 TaxID=3242698 RepID=UPI00359E4836